MFSLLIFLPLFNSICVGFGGFKLGTKGVVLITSASLISAMVLEIYVFLTISLDFTPTYITLLK